MRYYITNVRETVNEKQNVWIGKDIARLEFFYTVERIQIGTTVMENSMESTLKTEIRTTI